MRNVEFERRERMKKRKIRHEMKNIYYIKKECVIKKHIMFNRIQKKKSFLCQRLRVCMWSLCDLNHLKDKKDVMMMVFQNE